MSVTAETCGKCSAQLPPNAVLCTNCGTHVKSGMDVHTVKKVQAAKKAGSAVIRTILGIALACLTSILGAAFFAFTQIILENQIIVYLTGIGAVAVGGIAGLTFAGFFKERNVVLAALAIIPATFGMLAGEVLVANWSTGRYAREIAADNEDMCELVYVNRYIRRELKQDVVLIRCDTDLISFEPNTPVLLENDLDYDGLYDEAVADMKEDSEETRARVVKAFLQRNWSFIDRIKLGLNFLDFIWFGLAITTAWRIARGSWGGSFSEY